MSDSFFIMADYRKTVNAPVLNTCTKFLVHENNKFITISSNINVKNGINFTFSK